ncbi:MAG: pyrroline-5-carboxylate reductase [Kiritimatiellae bacterium]|nr:pyrroline-5-carboxylate reductase [Kiritimatiellia bacterium]MDW8458906.1 pyrroline-5-carboxylate reductase [Verrucomicrobiota bacterium]
MTDLLCTRVAFIGAGNMAEAMVSGLRRAGVPPENIRASDIRPEQLERFRRLFGVATYAANADAARDADVIVLAVKPQQMAAVLPELAPFSRVALFLSIAAGIPTARLEAALGSSARVVRAMPNTPALVGAGIAALCRGARATEGDLALAEALMRAVGKTVQVEEALMDAVTAISGSGPAYVFRIMESLERAAIAQGLPSEVARQLVLATIAGAGQLAERTGRAPAELRQQVTSKGGTTEAALREMEVRDLDGLFAAAVAAAVRRARELAAG